MNKKKEKRISNFLIGRKQKLSLPLTGTLNDSDKDGYVDIMDCNPINSKEHGFDNPLGPIFAKPGEVATLIEAGHTDIVVPGGTSPIPTPTYTSGETDTETLLREARERAAERARKEAIERARKEAIERARKEAIERERLRKEAIERARKEAIEKARKEAEEAKKKIEQQRQITIKQQKLEQQQRQQLFLEQQQRQQLFLEQQQRRREEKERPTKIIITKGKGVEVGGVTYHGNTIVPYSGGKTANQLRIELRKQYKEETGKSVGAGEISGTMQIPKPTKKEVVDIGVSAVGVVPTPTVDVSAPQFGTRTDYIQPPGLSFSGDIKTTPYLEERSTGKTIVINGKKTKLFETVYVDPTVKGEQFERPATAEELKFIETQRSALSLETGTASTEPRRFFSKVRDVPKKVETFFGMDLTSEQKGFKATEEFIVESIEKTVPGKAGTLMGGFVEGIIPTTPKEVGIMGATFGIGAGIGAGLKGASALAKTVPKFGGVLSSGVNIGGYVGGTYLMGRHVLDVTRRVQAEEDLGAKGEILGETAIELLVLGAGIKAGKKSFDIVRGKIITRGRTDIPFEKLTTEDVLTGKKFFPEAPKGKQLELFKGTAEKFPELAEGKPGAFHTTPETFWKGGKIVPQPGTSELAGLYGSSYVSPHFSRISGMSGSKFRLFPSWKSIITPEGKPGIAFLKPEKFRINPFTGKPMKPIIEGGKRVKEFVEFKKPTKPGTADLPLMKTEIEAVFRPGAGEYQFAQGKYYTTIKGVRVPIDVFEYAKDTGKIVKGVKTKPTLTQKGSYSLPTTDSYSLIEPMSGYGVLSSSVYRPTSSLVSPVSSTHSPIISAFSSSYKTISPTSSAYSPVSSSVISPISSLKEPVSYPRESVVSSPKPSIPTSPIYPSVSYPKPPKPIPPPPVIKLPKRRRLVSGQGWDVKVKRYSTDKNKMVWEKLNPKPLTKQSALGSGASSVDKDISASFKIEKAPVEYEKVKGKKTKVKKKIVDLGTTYFEDNKQKFREFKVRKGKKMVTTNKFIEKSGYRLDTPSEVQQIQQAPKSKNPLLSFPGETPSQSQTRVGIKNRNPVPLLDVKPQKSNPIANMGEEVQEQPSQFQKIQNGMGKISDTFGRFNTGMDRQSQRMKINVGGLSRRKNNIPVPKRKTLKSIPRKSKGIKNLFGM